MNLGPGLEIWLYVLDNFPEAQSSHLKNEHSHINPKEGQSFDNYVGHLAMGPNLANDEGRSCS